MENTTGKTSDSPEPAAARRWFREAQQAAASCIVHSALCILVAAPCAAGAVVVEDVFANTSWRQKKLIVETEISSDAAQTASIDVVVKDAAGKTVKTAKSAAELAPGRTVVKTEIPWADPITWELGRGYLYTLELEVADAKGAKSRPAPVTFGFREIWRDGKKIMMNGHEQCFRTVYFYHSNPNGLSFLQSMGYNAIHFSHVHEKDPKLPEDLLRWCSEHGMALVAPTTIVLFDEQDRIWADPSGYEAQLKRNLKRHRNWPCVAMCYVGVNNIVPHWSMEPQWTAIGFGDGRRSRLVERIAETGRTVNPNILYFSHGDGNCGDVASQNLYLNFTPLQEREEWMDKWGDPHGGTQPFQASEFGNPYFKCWYAPGVFSGLEYLAAEFGEAVYRSGPPHLQWTINDIYFDEIFRVQFPFYWDYQRKLMWLTNRGWRTAGANGGMVNFDIETGFGLPGLKWDDPAIKKREPIYRLDAPFASRPDWAWPSYDNHRLGNQDFLGYVGGAPRPSDKTHGYFGGEKVEKTIVMRWDYFEPASFVCFWQASVAGKRVGGGKISKRLECAQTSLTPIEFALPAVGKRLPGKIEAVFKDASGKELFRDEFPFEVHPAAARRRDWSKAPEIALYDPTGRSASIFKGLGVKNVRIVSDLRDAADATHVVVGKDALVHGVLAIDPAKVRAGTRVLILPQTPRGWRTLMVDGEGTMSRRLFLRDHGNPAFRGVSDDDLHDWRGAPHNADAKGRWKGVEYGPIWYKGSTRGPRWLYDMAVASTPLQTPDGVGFVPQIDGEFDLNYSGLLKFLCGKGSVTLCTLDLERRAGVDAAATEVADAVLADFLFGKEEPHDRPVLAMGAKAARLLRTVQCPAEEATAETPVPDGAVVLCSADARFPYAKAVEAAKRGARFVFVQDAAAEDAAGMVRSDKFAALRGLSGEDVFKTHQWLYRGDYDRANPLLRGMSAAHFRWRRGLYADVFEKAGPGYALDGGGVLAHAAIGAGRIVFWRADPEMHMPDTRGDSNRFRNNDARPTVERLYQTMALLLTNLGADPGDLALGRLLHPAGARAANAPDFLATAYVGLPATGEPACHAEALAGKPASDAWDGDHSRFRPDKNDFVKFGKLQPPEGSKGGRLYAVCRIAGNKGDEFTLRVEGGGPADVYLDGAKADGRGTWRLVLPKTGATPFAIVWTLPSGGGSKVTIARTKDGVPVEKPFPPVPGCENYRYYGVGIPHSDPYKYTYW